MDMQSIFNKAEKFGLVALLVLGFLPQLSDAQDRRTLENQIPLPVANGARATGFYGSARLKVAIGLPLGDKQGLTAFIDALYDPASPTYKSYLTPDQFTARFGPSVADYQKVVDFVKSSGLTVTATTPNRMIVDVTGSVSDFERVFQFKMRTYQHPSEPRQFHAPDVEPSVPADVPILDIIGLDDYMPPRRMDAKAEGPAAVHSNITGSGPNGSFQPKDFRAAYVPGVSLTGTGQSIGLFEIGPYDPNDIAIYEQATGLSNISIVNVLLDGVNGAYAPGYGDGEITLDIEMAMALAPGAQILVYEGTSFVDVINRMATDNAARQMSSSWAFGSYPAATMEQILMEYAAQGQTYFNCSLDTGAYLPTAQIPAPIGDPYVTVVGGTALVTTGPGGAWLSETAWKGSAGGFNSLYSIPSWQSTVSMATNMGSTRYRNFPDVAMVGDTILFAVSGGHMSSGTGGTSASTPLWAAFLALVNQQAAKNQKPPVGFLNPTLYALAQSSRYAQDLHDITVGNNTNDASPTQYYAVPGFDLTTGWGSPTGQNLMNDLTSGNAAAPGFGLAVAPYQITINPGGSGTNTVTVNGYGGFSSPVNLSVSGFPSGVTASFSPSSTTSSSTLTLTVPASVAVGYYPGTISATSGAAAKQTIAMTLVVVAPLTSDFAISASPSILNAAPGAGLQVAVSIGPVGTFASPVALSLTGAPQGVTASFSPASSAGNSTLTLSVGSQVAAGVHILNIAGSSGSLNHASTIGLVVSVSATPAVPVDLSTSYNVTGISVDGNPFLAGLGACCAYSANLLGTSLVSQNVPFLFGPASNGIAPPWNAVISDVKVPLPAGRFGAVQVLTSGKGGNQPAQAFVANYSDGTSDTFTQSVSDWNTPQNYPGETIVSTMAYSNQLSGAKVATKAYLYNYAFTLDVCKDATSFVLPKITNLNTLALTMVPATTACTATTVDSVNVVSGAAGISENAWIEIHGLNLAPSSVPSGGMTWSSAPEFAQGKMPTQLDGVSVMVNGNPAYVYYISQGQLDVLTPLDTKTGSVPVVVTNGTAVSASFSVDKADLTPAFAIAGGTKYLAATHANGSYVGPASEGAGFTPAAPGEEIVLYGFGFGLPNGGSVVAGSSTQTGTLPSLPTIQIGGHAAQVAFAGLISPGLYQFNVVVPSDASSGDNAVTAVYNKVSISTAGFIPVQ